MLFKITQKWWDFAQQVTGRQLLFSKVFVYQAGEGDGVASMPQKNTTAKDKSKVSNCHVTPESSEVKCAEENKQF